MILVLSNINYIVIIIIKMVRVKFDEWFGLIWKWSGLHFGFKW